MPKGIYKHKSTQGFQKGNKIGNRFKKGNKLGNKFKKGYISWNKDKFSLNIGKINLKMRGELHPRWNKNLKNQICIQCKNQFNSDHLRKYCSKKCYSMSLKGLYPYNLKGKRGIKPRTYYKTTNKYGGVEATEWRLKVFNRDNFTCQICKKQGGKLNAHHLLPFSKYPSERFDINNGLTLCLKCHSKTDSFGWKNYWKNYIAQATQELFI